MTDFYVALEKAFIILCLVVAIYYTIMCPCKTILACYKYTFCILLLIVLLYVGYKNFIHK
jgi:hypothetical protein